METYPSIRGPEKAPRQPCIAFYKYDGSNLRFEWNKKSGWNKFGTRKRLFDESDETFGNAIPMFLGEFADPLEKIFKKKYRDIQKVTIFCEFLGPNSFSGQHLEIDEHELKLIDVKLYKKGYISPREFVNIFCKNLPDKSAEVIYDGNLTDQFIRDVREGKYPVFEGVVCKGGSGHKLWRCKIKTDEYKEKLKEFYGQRWEDFWENR